MSTRVGIYVALNRESGSTGMLFVYAITCFGINKCIVRRRCPVGHCNSGRTKEVVNLTEVVSDCKICDIDVVILCTYVAVELHTKTDLNVALNSSVIVLKSGSCLHINNECLPAVICTNKRS